MLRCVKLREVLSDLLAVAGLGALCTAAWWLSPIVGLAAVGASLLLLGVALWAGQDDVKKR